MRGPGRFCLMAVALVPFAPACAAETGSILRAGDLMAQPYIDAAKTGPLAPQQAITIIQRQGAWVQVESEGRTGWVRTLNVRLGNGAATPATGARPAGEKPSLNPASLLRTGSSGSTVTTGVKGLDDEDIRNATVNYAELDQLATLGVDEAEARDNAQKSNLKENSVDYLKVRGR
jgi:hypothetical protein